MLLFSIVIALVVQAIAQDNSTFDPNSVDLTTKGTFSGSWRMSFLPSAVLIGGLKISGVKHRPATAQHFVVDSHRPKTTRALV